MCSALPDRPDDSGQKVWTGQLREQAEDAAADGNTEAVINGYAVQWDEEIDLYWFAETIRKGAFPAETREQVKLIEGHWGGVPYATVDNETMSMKEDDTGLAFEAVLDLRQQRALDIALAADRGDLTDVSIGFTLRGGSYAWKDAENDTELDLLQILEVGELFELSMVYRGAYSLAKIGETSFRDANLGKPLP